VIVVSISTMAPLTQLPGGVAYANALTAKNAAGYHSGEYYLKCMFGGVLACGVTHTAVVTLDVAKCRSQAHATSGKWPGGLIGSIGKSYELEGFAGITKGWHPTFWGYGMQGLFKFGFNEFFKDFYGTFAGDEAKLSTPAKMALWAAASGSAEFFADIALCPFEMTKVKMQVSLPGDAATKMPTGLMAAMAHLKAEPGTKFPFGSLVPLWGRQIPYTMIKFCGFYQTQNMVYDYLLATTGKAKSDYSEGEQLGLTFACGYWAGIFCAITTQPMDNLVSMKGNPINATKGWGEMASEMGTANLFTKGLVTRIIMIGTLTGLQWWIYGSWKSACGFGTS